MGHAERAGGRRGKRLPPRRQRRRDKGYARSNRAALPRTARCWLTPRTFRAARESERSGCQGHQCHRAGRLARSHGLSSSGAMDRRELRAAQSEGGCGRRRLLHVYVRTDLTGPALDAPSRTGMAVPAAASALAVTPATGLTRLCLVGLPRTAQPARALSAAYSAVAEAVARSRRRGRCHRVAQEALLPGCRLTHSGTRTG